MGSNIMTLITLKNRICKIVSWREFSAWIIVIIFKIQRCKLKRGIDFKWFKSKVVVFIWKNNPRFERFASSNSKVGVEIIIIISSFGLFLLQVHLGYFTWITLSFYGVGFKTFSVVDFTMETFHLQWYLRLLTGFHQ
jgi:hypothetical protein